LKVDPSPQSPCWLIRELEGQTREHQIERVGAQLREMMPWLAEGRLVDKAKN